VDAAPAGAVQHLAEILASAAFLSVVTYNHAALNDLVGRAASWPEVIYVSVEDAQGKVIAHSDPARVGQSWTAAGPAREAAPHGGALQEVTVPLSPGEEAGKAAAELGLVRLGYVTDAARPAAAPPPAEAAPPAPSPLVRLQLGAMLALAALTAVPVGVAVLLLGRGGAEPAGARAAQRREVGDPRQERSAVLRWMKEAEAVRAQLARERQEHARQAEHARLDRARLDAEMADLREEVRDARAALAGRPPGPRELTEEDLRQHQYRAIGYISHAIRSSLTNVLGFAKLLLRGDDGPLGLAQRTSVLSIEQAGTHLLGVVNDLADLTQAEARGVEVRDEMADVETALREVAAAAARALDRDPASIAVTCAPELPPVRASERRLVQILLPLAQPPVPEGEGASDLSARAEGQCVVVTVRHRAAGLPPQELPALFDPFSPVDVASTVQDDGRRLRLALARALTAALGGQVAVAAQNDGSTVFTVRLPAAAGVVALA
jgi:signal transduction histidine kinase